MWPVWLYKATLCSDSELGWVDDRGCQSHSHHAHCDACGPGNPWSAAGLLLLSFKAVRAQRHLGDTRIKNWLAALRVWCLRVILAWQYGRCLKRINLCIQHTAPSASHRWEHPEVPKCEILRPLRAPLPGFLSAQGSQRPWPPLIAIPRGSEATRCHHDSSSSPTHFQTHPMWQHLWKQSLVTDLFSLKLPFWGSSSHMFPIKQPILGSKDRKSQHQKAFACSKHRMPSAKRMACVENKRKDWKIPCHGYV